MTPVNTVYTEEAIDLNIADQLLAKGEDCALALLHGHVRVSYGELRARTDRLSRELLVSGSRRGDRIGIWSENNAFFVVAYLGVIKAGMVAVPFQTEVGESTFARIVRDAGIQSIFVSSRFERKVGPWAANLKCRVRNEEGIMQKDFRGLSSENPASEDDGIQDAGWGTRSASTPLPTGQRKSPEEKGTLAALLFTSGSTGEPKGVMISHRNIECNTRDIIEYMGLSPADRCMVVLPFHYCFGLSLLHTHLMAGGSMVLNNAFRLYPERVIEEMLEKECTGFAGVPSTYQILLRKSRFGQTKFPRLRWFQQAGGRLPNSCIEEIRHSFPGVKYFLMYGQTEATARLSFLPPERLSDKLGSVGQGLPSTKLEVVKLDGTPVRRSSNSNAGITKEVPDPKPKLIEGDKCEPLGEQPELGEIVASGDNIALGYWNDPEETAKYFRKGKLYTGDLAIVDQDGFIFIVERERDMIKSGGNRVSAKEIEELIAELPEVVEVAVVGVPHELLGEEIRAFLVAVASSTLTTSGVLMHCRRRLPSFKIPQRVIFLRAMPHNAAGKITKQKLKEWTVEEEEEKAANNRGQKANSRMLTTARLELLRSNQGHD